MKLKLTSDIAESVEPPPAGSAYLLIWDTELRGFGLRVTDGGARSWFCETDYAGRTKRRTIGPTSQYSALQARKEARRVLAEIQRGHDPLERERQAAKRGRTLEDAARQYLADKKLADRTRADYIGLMNDRLKPWLGKPIAGISRDDVLGLHREIGKTAQARANYTLRFLRAVINHADLETKNPVRMIPWFRQQARTGTIPPEKLRAFWDACGSAEHRAAGDYLRFLLLTGCRKTEGIELRVGDVTRYAFTLHDPKNHQPVTLPLSPIAARIVARNVRGKAPGERVFSDCGYPRHTLTYVRKVCGVDFDLHDLRRTFISMGTRLRLPIFIVKKLVNHKFSDVTFSYTNLGDDDLRAATREISRAIVRGAK